MYWNYMKIQRNIRNVYLVLILSILYLDFLVVLGHYLFLILVFFWNSKQGGGNGSGKDVYERVFTDFDYIRATAAHGLSGN